MKGAISKIFSENDVRTLRKVLISVPSDFMQFYTGAAEYFQEISAAEHRFMYFLFNEMDENNVVHPGSTMIRKYMKQMGLSENMASTEPYIRKIISTLKRENILIKTSRSVYVVNPLIVWRRSADERKQLIRSLIETGYTLESTKSIIKANGKVERGSRQANSPA